MFDVEYKGANAVVFTTKKTRVVFDPKLSLAGGNDVSVDGDVEVLTEERFGVSGTPRLRFDGPGEYEVGDVSLTGVPAVRHIDTAEQGMLSTMYRVMIGDVRIAVIGNVAKKLSDEQLEMLGVVDIMVLPVGGNGYTLDATDASTLIRQVEPRAVVPVHYADAGLQYEVPQDAFDIFAQTLNANVIEEGAKWKVKNASALPEQLSIIKIARS